MSNRVDRYQKHRKMTALFRKKQHIYAVSYSDQVKQLLDLAIDNDFIQRFFAPQKAVLNHAVTDNEINQYLAQLEQQLKQQKQTDFVAASKQLISNTVSNTLSGKSKQVLNNTVSKVFALPIKRLNRKRTSAKKHRNKKVRETKNPQPKQEMKQQIEQHLQQSATYLVSECSEILIAEFNERRSQGWQDNNKKRSWKETANQHVKIIKNKVLINGKEHMVSTIKNTMVNKSVLLLLTPFVKTGKNVSQAMQQGLLSLVKAVTTLAFPPAEMSREQAAHEASKILLTGLIISTYSSSAELITATLSSHAVPFADTLSSDIADIISGISVLLAVLLLDKMDFFGVEAAQQQVLIMEILEASIVVNSEIAETLSHAYQK